MAETTHGKADEFGSGRLAIADARLAFILLNHGRHWALRRMFGTTREQANALTAVLLLGAADGTFAVARRVVHVPHTSSGDAGIGLFGLHEAMMGISGPAGRDAPATARLLAFALIAGVATPGIARNMKKARAAQRRIREGRIARYRSAEELLRSAQERAGAGPAARAAQATARVSSAFTNPSLPST